MLSVYERIGWVPRFLGYDDACHLHIFAHDRSRFAIYKFPSAVLQGMGRVGEQDQVLYRQIPHR